METEDKSANTYKPIQKRVIEPINSDEVKSFLENEAEKAPLSPPPPATHPGPSNPYTSESEHSSPTQETNIALRGVKALAATFVVYLVAGMILPLVFPFLANTNNGGGFAVPNDAGLIILFMLMIGTFYKVVTKE